MSPDSPEVCPSCGWTLQEFRKTGRLGCAFCYEAFPAALDLWRRREGFPSGYEGLLPNPQKGEQRARIEAQRELERELEQAIQEERYEDAASLRDRLKGDLS